MGALGVHRWPWLTSLPGEYGGQQAKQLAKSGTVTPAHAILGPQGRLRTPPEVKLAIKVEQRRIKRVYTYEVQQNPKAQTYLYQPYSYKYAPSAWRAWWSGPRDDGVRNCVRGWLCGAGTDTRRLR